MASRVAGLALLYAFFLMLAPTDADGKFSSELWSMMIPGGSCPVAFPGQPKIDIGDAGGHWIGLHPLYQAHAIGLSKSDCVH